jgi:hypothetical protein
VGVWSCRGRGAGCVVRCDPRIHIRGYEDGCACLACAHWLFPVSNLTVAPDARTDSNGGAAGANGFDELNTVLAA